MRYFVTIQSVFCKDYSLNPPFWQSGSCHTWCFSVRLHCSNLAPGTLGLPHYFHSGRRVCRAVLGIRHKMFHSLEERSAADGARKNQRWRQDQE